MKNSQKILNSLLWIFVGVALLGFFDAAFLTIKHFVGGTLPCFNQGSCDLVTTSKYSLIMGIPVALLGALYYLATLIVSLVYALYKKPWARTLSVVFVGIGFVFTLWFMYAQLFLIHAICLYCVGSALSTTILLILNIIIWRIMKNHGSTSISDMAGPRV